MSDCIGEDIPAPVCSVQQHSSGPPELGCFMQRVIACLVRGLRLATRIICNCVGGERGGRGPGGVVGVYT